MAGAGVGESALGFGAQQLDTGGDGLCLAGSCGDGAWALFKDEGVVESSNSGCEERFDKKPVAPSSNLRLCGMLSNALAMFWCAACIVLCLLPDFWTLPGAGDDVEGAEDVGDCVASLPSIGTS